MTTKTSEPSETFKGQRSAAQKSYIHHGKISDAIFMVMQERKAKNDAQKHHLEGMREALDIAIKFEAQQRDQ